MIEVLPIQSKTEQKELCEQCGAEYKEYCMAYGAHCHGETVGICQFAMNSEGGVIYDIATSKNGSPETEFLMGRAALNFIDLCGVHYASYGGKVENEPLLLRIGFSKNSDGKYGVDLTDFFTSPCEHDKKK